MMRTKGLQASVFTKATTIHIDSELECFKGIKDFDFEVENTKKMLIN